MKKNYSLSTLISYLCSTVIILITAILLAVTLAKTELVISIYGYFFLVGICWILFLYQNIKRLTHYNKKGILSTICYLGILLIMILLLFFCSLYGFYIIYYGYSYSNLNLIQAFIQLSESLFSNFQLSSVFGILAVLFGIGMIFSSFLLANTISKQLPYSKILITILLSILLIVLSIVIQELLFSICKHLEIITLRSTFDVLINAIFTLVYLSISNYLLDK